MSRERWNPEVKARAVALAGAKGAAVASAETGVPEGTIRSWIHRAVSSASSAIVPAVDHDVATVARPKPWPERRESVVESLMDGLDETTEAARNAVRDGKLRDARDGWISVGVIIDKLQLLSGDATSRAVSVAWRHESSDRRAVEREIAELEEQLGLSRGERE